MLAELRKQSRSVIIYVLFGIIIVVFVFTFNQASTSMDCGGGGRSATALVKVGDTEIDTSALHMGLALSADPPPPGSELDPAAFQMSLAYRSTRFIRMRGGPRYNLYIPDPKGISPLKVRKVADDLIETWLVSDEALAQGLRVSGDEVRDRVVQNFTDGATGTFNKKRYEDWVRYGLHTSLPRFEDFVRRELLREKLIDFLVSGIQVSDREARFTATGRKAKANYEFVEVSPELIAEAQPPSTEEALAWLGAHQADAQKYFDEHKDEYRVEPSYDFHVIKAGAASRRMIQMIKEEDGRRSLAESRAEAKGRIEKLAEGLKSLSGAGLVEAFEKAAQSGSDDQKTVARGGRVEKPMPASAVAMMAPEAVPALDKAEAGTLVGPIEGDDGFYLLILDGKTPGADAKFEDARDRVALRLLGSERAKGRVDTLASEILAKASADPKRPLTEVATEANLPFAPSSPIKWGETGEFSGSPDSLSGLADWTPDTVPGLGESAELSKSLRDLSADKPLGGKVFRVTGSESRFIVRLKSRASETEVSADDVQNAREEILPLKRQAFYREWYNRLRATAAQKARLIEHETLQAQIRDEAKAIEESLKARVKKEPRFKVAPSEN
jgi:hypothetical protein